MNTKTIDICELANNLSNNQMCELINHFGNRIHLFHGVRNMQCIFSEFSHATMNGSIIQINSNELEKETT